MPQRNSTLGVLATAAVTCAAASSAFTTPALASPAIVITPVAAFEAETMALSTSLGRVNADAAASAGKGLTIWSNGAAVKGVTTPLAADRLAVRVRGSQCSGGPKMMVRVDGIQVFHGPVSSTTYMDVPSSVTIPAGAHKVTVALTNDFRTSWCDRNLFVDNVALTAEAALAPDPVLVPMPSPGD